MGCVRTDLQLRESLTSNEILLLHPPNFDSGKSKYLSLLATSVKRHMKEHNCTAHAACVALNMAHTTFLNYKDKPDNVVIFIGRKTALPALVEDKVADAVLLCADRAKGLSLSEICTIAYNIAKRLNLETGNWVAGEEWAHNFLLRHPKLSNR
jgi:hypothetical protein